MCNMDKLYKTTLEEMYPIFQSSNNGRYGYETIHGCHRLNSAIYKSERAAKNARGSSYSVFYYVTARCIRTLLDEINTRFDVGTNQIVLNDEDCIRVSDDETSSTFISMDTAYKAVKEANKVRLKNYKNEDPEFCVFNEIWTIFSKYENKP